jgi:hypothetical protein
MTSTQSTPSARELCGDVFSLVCAMAFYGPPVVFIVAPWLLLGLVLSGPFALLLTFAVVAAALVAGLALLLATPFMVIGGLRAVRVSLAPAPVQLRRVTA